MTVTLKGACAHFSGHARVFRCLVDRLRPRMDIEVLALNNKVPPGYPLDICDRATGRGLGVLFSGGPPSIMQLPTRYRVLYAMCEASDIPLDWKRDLRLCDEVWVPSTFCAEVFRANGRKALALPFGYDETIFNRRERSGEDRDRFWGVHCPEAVGKLVVGTAGVMSKRKGIDVLLKAWGLAAPEDAALVVKTRDTRMLLTEFPPNAYIVDEDWPDETLADFYRSIDLFVLPSRGEGLSLCPLEAVACGTPAITTRATGAADYIDDRGIYGLDTRGTSRTEGMAGLPDDAVWVEPDGRQLVDMLKALAYSVPEVEHRYRQWSMGELATRWEAELHAAQRRAAHARRLAQR